MKLSIVTVTYQSQEYIQNCILSVISHALGISYEHIIVDNASTDGTVSLIEEEFASDVILIKNEKNVGFAAANNQAVKLAQGEFLLFLNPDMEFQEGYLDKFVDWFSQRPEIGIASCKLLNYCKRVIAELKPLKFPSLQTYIPSFLGIKPFFCSIHPHFYYPSFNVDLEQEVDTVRGAFMLIRREVVEKLGFAFDPRYFILFEDIDLCREVKKMGLKVIFSPLLTCCDYSGRSFSKQTKAWKYVQMVRSFKTYVKKWHSQIHLLWIVPLAFFGFIIRIPKWAIKKTLF